MSQKLNQAWDLESIFPGGSASPELKSFIHSLESDVNSYSDELKNLDGLTKEKLTGVLHKHSDLSERLLQAFAYIECLEAQDVTDKKAGEWRDRVYAVNAAFESCDTSLNSILSQIPENEWENWISSTEPLKEVSFYLKEKRDEAKDQLPTDQEALINTLKVNGYHAWGKLYDTTVGNMTIPFDHPEEGHQELSVGQASNLLDDPDRNIRTKAFAAWEDAWKKNADFTGSALNHLAGFRLDVYKQRGWDNVLKEPLKYNRMSQETLEQMWSVISKNKSHLVKYLERKAELLGLEKLDWTDVEAPVFNTSNKKSYDEAADFIVRHFSKFHEDMGSFARHAMDNRWVEAENRPNKSPGGFCTGFPLNKETRIFMTFNGSPSNVSTLAHELGHAYHYDVMKNMNFLNQDSPMNLAETASTFAESIISDAAIKETDDVQEKIALLDDKIQRAVAFFMNIHARFLFETRFYEERKNGLVSTERLDELMSQAQADAFANALDRLHPQFWESKLHFYITDVPFYNFPYTFGYMFSTGIYARALKEGPTFAEKYDALLRDTGAMTVEDLAKKHLDTDLTQPDFWQEASNTVIEDVEQFLSLTETRVKS